jgi:hypothetical protein
LIGWLAGWYYRTDSNRPKAIPDYYKRYGEDAKKFHDREPNKNAR